VLNPGGQAQPQATTGARPVLNAPDGVTILIPNWNHEYFLGRSIGSALRAVRDLRAHGVSAEVMVIDDGSRDGSITLLRQLEALYYEDGLRVVFLDQNTGALSLVRNRGMQLARYRYVSFLDADDELVSENMWHFYRSIRDTGADIIYGNMIGVSPNPDHFIMISNESFQQRLLAGNYIGALCLADRLKVMDVGGFLPNKIMVAREDWELYLHLAANGRRLVFVPIVMGIYYHDIPDSITKEQGAREVHLSQQAYVRRVYNQVGIRARLPVRSRHLRYHPDVGYL
jgi:glycosyltransferase involved in cell wall biosynthesis